MANNKSKDRGDLEHFLRNVDEVESIIKGLAANDNKASRKADEWIRKYEAETQVTKKQDNTCVNRTVINQEAFDSWDKAPAPAPGPQLNSDTMDPASFMAALEADCHERAERRKQYEADAQKLKELGNAKFAEGDFAKAVELYTESLSHIRDWTILWTNRAQAYLKLENFEAALEDCRWAFKVDENCLKAAILEGKAHLGMKAFDKARESYKKALKIAPQKESMINDYLTQVNVIEKADVQEKSARALFDAGQYTGLVSLMEKLNRVDQSPLYYIGGLQVICQAMKDTTDRTLFRTNGGLLLGQTHPELSKCLSSCPDVVSDVQAQLIATYFDVLLQAARDDEPNQHELLSSRHLPTQILAYLECRSSQRCIAVAEAAVKLLLYLSQSEHGRTEIVARYDVVRLITVAFNKDDVGVRAGARSSVSLSAQRLITNLAMEPKFRRQVYAGFEPHVLQSFEATMLGSESVNLVSVHLAISMMMNLCGDSWLRRKAAAHLTTWIACIGALSRHADRASASEASNEILSALLGLLANMAVEGLPKDSGENDEFVSSLRRLCSVCCSQIKLRDSGDIFDRCYLVLSRVLKFAEICPKIVSEAFDCGLVQRTLSFMVECGADKRSAVKSGIACLAIISRHNADSRTVIVDWPKGLKSVVSLLSDADDVIVGNAALCLSHCVELRRASKALAKTNIVMDLLVLARDQAKPTVQHNCAILIAKLAQGDPQHLERLRELHGLEILNTVLKHVE